MYIITRLSNNILVLDKTMLANNKQVCNAIYFPVDINIENVNAYYLFSLVIVMGIASFMDLH